MATETLVDDPLGSAVTLCEIACPMVDLLCAAVVVLLAGTLGLDANAAFSGLINSLILSQGEKNLGLNVTTYVDGCSRCAVVITLLKSIHCQCC